LGASARPAVPRLLEAGRNTNFGVRYQAVRALGAIGEGAVEAVPALREWSRDTNSFIRLASKDALKKIIPNEVAASGPTNPPAAAAHARDPENP
jgi:HEAT repeat protein